MTSIQRKISGLLERMYEMAARSDNSSFAFSQYNISAGNGGLVLQGHDGWAVERIAACLNMAFRNDASWQKVRAVPVSFHERRNAVALAPRDSAQWRASYNDPSNKIMVDVGFFSDPLRLQMLEECAQRLTPPPAVRELSLSRA